MDIEAEKQRLLNCIEIIKLFDDVDINLENIGLKIDEFYNAEPNLTILSNIVMDANQVLKYEIKKSSIFVSYTLYDKQDRIMDERKEDFQLSGGVTYNKFNGFRSISCNFIHLNIKEITRIEIRIGADLHKKWCVEYSDDSINHQEIINDDFENQKIKLLNSIERFPKIEEKYGISIENIGVKKQGDYLFFYIDVIVDYEDWNDIIFSCVLYDSDNNIIDNDKAYIYSSSFVGISSLTFMINNFDNPNIFYEIEKVRIYPSEVNMINHTWDDLDDDEEDI